MPSVSSFPQSLGTKAGTSALRLLFLASTQSQGGIERHSVEIAAALQARGVPLQFACPPGSYLGRWCQDRRIPTLPFSVQNSGDLAAVLHLARLIHAHQIDIVHAHSRRDYMVAVLGTALARRFFSCRPSLVLHAHMLRPLGEPLRLASRFFVWGADAVAAVSAAVRDRLRQDHGFSASFVPLIYNGVDLDEFPVPGSVEALARRKAARAAWDIPAEALLVGMVGRLDAKGQRSLLDVTPDLAAKHPALCLVFIGSEGKPGELARLTNQAKAAGLADRLLFTGSREDVPRLLPAFDVLVHLPRDESFGLTLAEAMAAGLPTVATDIGGCREVVRDGVTGFLLPPGDLPALTSALSVLLDPTEGPVRREAFGTAGRRIVEDNFSRDRQVSRLLALYDELCPAPLPREI